jgi:hypothetical protein
MPNKKLTGGWMIEVVSSGVGGRRRRYPVAIADQGKAIDLIISHLGPDTDITTAVSVSQKELEVAKLDPGKFAPV